MLNIIKKLNIDKNVIIKLTLKNLINESTFE